MFVVRERRTFRAPVRESGTAHEGGRGRLENGDDEHHHSAGRSSCSSRSRTLSHYTHTHTKTTPPPSSRNGNKQRALMAASKGKLSCGLGSHCPKEESLVRQSQAIFQTITCRKPLLFYDVLVFPRTLLGSCLRESTASPDVAGTHVQLAGRRSFVVTGRK